MTFFTDSSVINVQVEPDLVSYIYKFNITHGPWVRKAREVKLMFHSVQAEKPIGSFMMAVTGVIIITTKSWAA